MITNLIFDLGNVLMDYHPKMYLHQKYHDEKVEEHLYQSLFASPLWLQLDQGLVEHEEVIAALSKNDPNCQAAYQSAFQDWGVLLQVNQDVIQWVQRSKQAGYHVYLLSNLQKTTWDYLTSQQAALLSLLDGQVLSFQEKLLKPQKEIFQVLLQRYHLNPENCLFFDDRPENIEGGRACGISGVIFTGWPDLEQAYQNYQIKIPK